MLESVAKKPITSPCDLLGTPTLREEEIEIAVVVRVEQRYATAKNFDHAVVTLGTVVVHKVNAECHRLVHEQRRPTVPR